MIIHRKDKTHSISKIVATSSRLSRFFGIYLSIGSIPVYLTLAFYLIPKYNVSDLVSILIIPIYITQTIIACFPDRGNSKSSIHVISAFVCGFLLVLFCTLICILGIMPLNLRLILIQFILIVPSSFCLLLLSEKVRRYVFSIEVLFLIEWVATISLLLFL
jgi:hypothetical protein